MAMTRKELVNSKNKGFAFEAKIALQRKWKRDGRPGSYDLSHGGKVFECKFFTVKPATAKKNAEYNSAHGFPAVRSRSLREQLEEYCATFDTLIVGVGENVESCEVFSMKSSEAVEWLYKRMQFNKQEDGVRFCWGGKSIEKRYLTRFAKLKAEGFKL